MPFFSGRTLLKSAAVSLFLMRPAAYCAEQPRWQVQFFHDVDESEFNITDLVFPTAKRGVASGILTTKGKPQPTVITTSDGGKQWKFVEVPEPPISVFFVDDSIGWMVTDRGVWRTEEGGLTWHKVSKLRDLLRVYFLDEKHGFAAGTKKSVYETLDGGKEWSKLEIADKIETDPEHTAFSSIEFSNPKVGSIAGWSRAPRRRDSEFPDWMDPEHAERRRQWPSSTIVIQTVDGGKTWQLSVTSMFGRITRLRGRDSKGLTLVEFQDAFEYPSEVYFISSHPDKTQRTYRDKEHAVTDVALTENAGYLTGIHATGKLRQSPVPGRLFVLTSKDFVKWVPMEVDYRAYARRAILAAVDERNIWIATDTGMILKLSDGS